jgi:hypothetical protein
VLREGEEELLNPVEDREEEEELLKPVLLLEELELLKLELLLELELLKPELLEELELLNPSATFISIFSSREGSESSILSGTASVTSLV